MSANGDCTLLANNVGSNQDANARLMAAAPDMAEALRGMVTLHEQRELVRGTSYDDVRVEAARAALAKAGL